MLSLKFCVLSSLIDRDEKKVENKKINKPALPGANISEIFFLTWIMCTLSGGMIRGPVWHNTRSLPIGFTVAAQYEVQCGTIRGPMRHNTRYSLAARYEVLDTKSRTKFFQFRWFLDPSGPNQLYQT